MKNNFLLLLSLSFFIAISGVGCEGPEGPTGPQGDQGEQGPVGPQGEQGPSGEDGTANVIYSEWMDIDWNFDDGTTQKSMLIDESRVLGDFMDNGTVLMFLKVEAPEGSAAVALPNLNGTDLLSFVLANVPGTAEGIMLQLQATDNTTPVQSDWSDYQVRYILIPGGVPAKMSADFFKNYQAVIEYYGIQD